MALRRSTRIAEPREDESPRPPARLDEIDRRLIALLRLDGRTSNRALAAEVDLNEVTVAARLRRMAEAKALRIIAQLDLEAFGYPYHLTYKIKAGRQAVRDVAAALGRIPEVVAVSITVGPYDVITSFVARDRADMSRLVDQRILKIRGIADVSSTLALEVLKYTPSFALLRGVGEPIDLDMAKGRVDDLDLAIIGALLQDARRSNRSIGADLGVSEAAIRSRVKRLEEAGFIHITAVADVFSMGIHSTAMIGIDVAGTSLAAVARSVAAIPEVSVAARTLGDHPLYAIATTADRDALQQLVLDRIGGLPGVARTETLEYLTAYKHSYGWARFTR